MAASEGFSESAYFRISIEELRAFDGKERLVPLYTYFPQTGHLQLRFESGEPVSLTVLELYRRNGLKHLWCPIEFKEDWEDSWKDASGPPRPSRPENLDSKLDTVKNELAQDAIEALLAPEFKPRERQALLAGISTQQVAQLRGLTADDPIRIEKALAGFQGLTDEIVRVLADTSGAQEIMAAVGLLKEMIPQHSGVCSSLSVLIAMGLGHTDPAELVDLSIAATLHDLGLCRVPGSVVAQNWDQLSPVDLVIFAEHVQHSLKMIEEKGIHISPRSRALISQHHERFDGRGFPLGLQAGNLNELAQILSLVDQMDDWMSGKRGNRRRSPVEALSVLKGSTAFRPGLVDAVVLLMGGDLRPVLAAHQNFRTVREIEGMSHAAP